MVSSVDFLTGNPERMSLPVHRRELAMFVFLISLAVFFLFTLASVVIIRGVKFPSPEVFADRIPNSFIWSSVLLFGGSHSIFRALYNVRKQKLLQMKYWLVLSLMCAIGFTGLQSLGIKDVLLKFDPTRVYTENVGTYKPVRFANIQNETLDPAKLQSTRYQMQFNVVAGLVGLHVIHFLGGVIFLSYICTQAFANRYDHEYYSEIKLTAYYWRFLDVVWVLMLGTICFAA